MDPAVDPAADPAADPDAFEVELPSEPAAPAVVSLDLDSDSEGAMSAPAEDFATEIADIAQMDDVLDGLTDL
jgi:hypothetical protein